MLPLYNIGHICASLSNIIFLFKLAYFLAKHICLFVQAGSSPLQNLFSSCKEGATLYLWYTGFSLQWLFLLWSTVSRVHGLQYLQLVGPVAMAPGLQSTGSVVVRHGLICSSACGISLDQGSNPCPLNQQADSLPLSHQGSPNTFIFKRNFFFLP